MIKELDIEEFIKGEQSLPLIDVRSPGEYNKAHIPGAMNIPLFTDEERAHVGTVYKQQSKEEAIKLGYYYVNPKLDDFIDQAKSLAPDMKLVVHCWRGGMRSKSFAEHLQNNGFEVAIIRDGYKAFRRLALESFSNDSKLNVLGGYTGSGKTQILLKLKELGHQVIDLEGIANHKGSAFGAIGCDPQPTTEQFENNLYWQWKELDFLKSVWLEDESSNIGRVIIPSSLFLKMRQADLIFIDIPKETRGLFLIGDYCIGDNELLANSIQNISKRLGGEKTKKALDYLEKNDFYNVALICLDYYDKYYYKGMIKRDTVKTKIIKSSNTNCEENINKILKEI
jgi:tRNA 2-selenouridine synthase